MPPGFRAIKTGGALRMPSDGKWILRVVVLAAALAAVVYGGALDAPLAGPDKREVIDDYYLGAPGSAVKLFVSGRSDPASEVVRYEPLAGLSLATGRTLHGAGARGFRVISLLMHVLSTLLLFLVMKWFGVGPLWAGLAALLFAVHPLHTQAIMTLSARARLLCGLLTLGAVVAFCAPLSRAAAGERGARYSWLWVGIALFLAGLFAGQEALAAGLMLCLMPRVLGVRFPHAKFYAAAGVCLALYAAMGALGRGSLGLRDGYWGAASMLEGLSLIVFPSGQMIYHPISFVHSWADGRALGALGLALAAALAALTLRSRARSLSLALTFLACAIPACALTASRAGVLFEPGLYLLVAAACATLAALAELGSRLRRGRPVLAVALMALIGAGALGARARCSVWEEPERIWLEVLEAYPGDPLATMELAEYYRGAGFSEKAAALVSPSSEDAESRAVRLNNEGVALRDSGRTAEAARKFREAVDLWPGFRDAHFNLGVIYHGMGMTDSAEASFERAIAVDPFYAEARYNLGIIYDAAGDEARAEAEYREAVRLSPGHSRALANLGSLLAREGRTGEAIEILERAVEVDPGLPQARFNLALAYERVDVERAKENWRVYLELARQRGVNPMRIRQVEERLQSLQ